MSALFSMAAVQWLSLASIMLAAWIVQQRTGNSGWVDVFWTFGTGAVASLAALLAWEGDHAGWRAVIVAALVAAWSLRLGSYLFGRTLGSDDDPRYADMARQWGEGAGWRMALLLQAQALAALPLTMAVAIAAHRPGPLGLVDAIGMLVLLAAIIGEGIADRQLAAFRADPANAGRVCDRGLWSWSRHPNYFFQWVGWLAYPVIAIDPSGGWAAGWLTLMAPAAMYWFLVHVSGIPPLEAHMLRSRGDAFRHYQQRTSAFFPMPPSAEARTVS